MSTLLKRAIVALLKTGQSGLAQEREALLRQAMASYDIEL
jgi:hypothetical protein